MGISASKHYKHSKHHKHNKHDKHDKDNIGINQIGVNRTGLPTHTIYNTPICSPYQSNMQIVPEHPSQNQSPYPYPLPNIPSAPPMNYDPKILSSASNYNYAYSPSTSIYSTNFNAYVSPIPNAPPP